MINKDYLYTEFCDVKTLALPADALYLYEQDTEDRSVYCSSELKANNPSVRFVGIVEGENDMVELKENETSINSLSLNSSNSILTIIRSWNPPCIYLDVTGMNCRVAAPILKVLLEEGFSAKVVYAEPSDYIVEELQKEGLHNDLSEMVDGVQPLPCLKKMIPYDEDNPPVFVSLLGFEGGRFAYLVTDQNPLNKKIRPIVGVPGYKMKYPYISLWGNRNVLTQRHCWKYIDYAEANSIVDIYYKLGKIYQRNHHSRMVVAPIGTKPHAIGAIIYAIKHPDAVEILYDNPKRTLHRTKGVGRVSICDVTSLFNS